MKGLPRLLVCTGILFAFAAGTAFASPTLREGAHGHDVLVLQQALQKAGYKIKNADGVFGKDTERAVAEFQRDNKIKITGVVNNATWRALKNAPSTRPWGVDIAPPTKKNLPLAPNGKPILPASKVSDVIKTAKSYMGTPYIFGGATPKGFDCSGYLQYVFQKHGIATRAQQTNSINSDCVRKAQRNLCPAISSSSRPTKRAHHTAASTSVRASSSMPRPAKVSVLTNSPTATGSRDSLAESTS